MSENKTHNLIGGMFALPDFTSKRKGGPCYDFLSSSNLFLANARSAIIILINILRCRTIWFPSYLCPDMVNCIAKGSVDIQFYPVNAKLKIGESPDWLGHVKKNDLVILIDYFGFPSDGQTAGNIKDRGGWVLEDASQALLTTKRVDNADFIVVSPRKFTGVPDGGVLISNCEIRFDNIVLNEIPLYWWLGAFEASASRRAYDKNDIQDRTWFSLFKKNEQSMPVGYYSMSHISKYLLTDIIDFPVMIKKRIDNYLFLLNRLKEWAIFHEMDTDTVPLGFPVCVNDRDAVREKLFSVNIFPPVHWDLDNVVPDAFGDSYGLSKRIMTLPCDQRYGAEEMERMASVFEKIKPCRVQL